MSKKYTIIFGFILLFAALLRTFGLDHSPPHLSNDEISIAYDAYSVSKTLRDEHNNKLPLSFQSHNTYKAPLLTYVAIPFTKIIGNSEYAVRLPSALFGVATIFFVGLLVFTLTKNQALSLLASFILTVTPWHIHTSRMAYEANVALFFVIAGIYAFYKGVLSNKIWIILTSFVLFAISLYGYHTQWGFTPVLIVLLLVLHFPYVRKHKYVFLTGILLFTIVVFPLFLDFLHNLQTHARANTEIISKEVQLETAIKQHNFSFIQRLQLYFNTFLNNYSAYLNPGHLFFYGLGVPSNKNPFQLGLFPAIFLPSFFIGWHFVKKYFSGNARFIYIWALLTPIIPSLTINAPNHIRNLVSVVPYVILIAVGTYWLWQRLNLRLLKMLGIVLIFLSTLYTILFYYVHLPMESAEGAQYGYKQIAQYINGHYTEYAHILIDPKFGDLHFYDGVPHLYIPYFTYLDPQHYLDTRRSDIRIMYFDKYEIRDFKWPEITLQPDTLYVVPSSNTPPDDIKQQLEEVHVINYPNGKKGFALYKMK